jgi:hypothetical protein
VQNGGYHSVQNLLSSRALSKNLKIKTYKTIILLIILYQCEIWFLALHDEHNLRVFGNGVLGNETGSNRRMQKPAQLRAS